MKHSIMQPLTWSIVAALTIIPLAAQPTPPSAAADLTRILDRTVVYRDVAISPDGSQLAWIQQRAAATDTNIYTLAWRTAGAVPKPIVISSKPHREAGLSWSPDSRSLAFFSNGGQSSQRQLWIATATGARPYTKLKGYAERPRWSPDGKQIAFLYVESGAGGGPLGAVEPMTGVIDTAFHNQRIAILDVASGAVTQSSPADLHVYDFDWSPDSKHFAVTAAPGPGDNNWWIAQLHIVDAVAGTARSIYRPKLQIAVPRWSPDGQQVAFIEGIMSDEGFHGGDVYTVPAAGGDATNQTPQRKSSPSSVTWLSPQRLLLTEWKGGGSAITQLDLNTHNTETLWQGDEAIRTGGHSANFALARDGVTSVVARDSYTTAPEVWGGRIGDWKPLTRMNAGLQPTWGKGENIEWTSEGRSMQGWLLPPAKTGAGRHPLIVIVHGGPSGVATPTWPSDNALAALFASRGYFVFLPNPRGSYGQGEAFTQANVKDFGHGDLTDILAGVDKVLAGHPIDPDRLGITGWSYGGFMTMWTVTQTNRFKAAMAGAGIANWLSYYGQNSIDQWMIPFFGASVYDDPAVYDRSSPIRYIKNVKTPTLVIVGERDGECPAPQSFEFWHALKTLGVPTQLVVYPGEGHHFEKPEHRLDMQNRTLAWFDQYLKP